MTFEKMCWIVGTTLGTWQSEDELVRRIQNGDRNTRIVDVRCCVALIMREALDCSLNEIARHCSRSRSSSCRLLARARRWRDANPESYVMAEGRVLEMIQAERETLMARASG